MKRHNFWWGGLLLLGMISHLCGLDTLRLDYVEFEKEVLKNYPLLLESEITVEQKKLALKKLEMSAWLPKFQINMGFGPAPGLENIPDSNFIVTGAGRNDSVWVENSHRRYDLSSWGPFFGVDVGVIQPLNLYRYRSGTNAAKLAIKVTEAEHYKEKLKVSKEAVEIYYGYLMAKELLREITQAEIDFDKAEETIEELLDDESESVSQKDLLKLKASRYRLVKAKNQTLTGLARAKLGARFYLFLKSKTFAPKDTVLLPLSLVLPPLDTLKLWTLKNHPDLKRLEHGLAARREMLKVARGELGPDIFLFGTFKYAKAWSAKREAGEREAFASDPLNEIDGAAGLGMRLRLNFWSRIQDFKKKKLELKKLKRTEIYAARGLLGRLEEAYVQLEEARLNMKAARASLRAAEAWLKGAAMDYDLDPTLAMDLISPYKEALNGRNNYYQSIFEYNKAVVKVILSVGWTLTDYLSNVSKE